MKKTIISAVVAATIVSFPASAQEPENQNAPRQSMVPFVDVTGQRIAPQDAERVSQSNQSLLDQVNQLDEQAKLMEEEALAQAMYNKAILGEPVNQPANKFLQDAIDMYKPSMTLSMDTKDAIVIPIGQGLLNTLSTNYSELRVKTSDKTSIIETEKGELFISPTTSNPIGLVLFDAGVPESKVSVTLVPIDAPPVIVDLKVKLSPEMKAKSANFLKELALEEAQQQAQSETVARSDKHTQRIIETLIPVAQGDLPAGFTLSNEVPYDMRQPCKMAIPHVAGQRLLGGNEVIDVVVARNTTDRIYQVREEMCLSSDSIAVAIHKRAHLAPNEEVEIYILRDKNFRQEVKREKRRPRLTLGE